MLLNTIYEHSADKHDCKGKWNIVSGVKYIFAVLLATSMYVTNFKHIV